VGWALQVLIGVGTAGLAFAGAIVGQRLDYRRWHREETMRLLRWGVERTTEADELAARSGLVVLRALVGARLLQREDRRFVRRIVTQVAQLRTAAYPEGIRFDIPGGSDG
jgi:hypothetical protein